MITRRYLMAGGAAGLVAALATSLRPRAAMAGAFPVSHTDAEWRKLLSPAQYQVLRQDGTEAPFTSPLNHEKRSGHFACAGCDLDLFSSATKFDSGTGWPSFWAPARQGGRPGERRFARHEPDRRELCALRRSSGPRLRRRAATDGPALLHERRRDDLQAGSRLTPGLAGPDGAAGRAHKALPVAGDRCKSAPP